MKILVTGFKPFGGETLNPSEMLVSSLPAHIGDTEIHKVILPVAYNHSIDAAINAIRVSSPDCIIMLGQAGGRTRISIERIAINFDDSAMPDNFGCIHSDSTISESSPSAFFSTLPIRGITEHLHKHNIPAEISNTAGTFVCNHVMFGILNYIAKNNLNTIAGFIHIPYIPEQVLSKNSPSVPLIELERGIREVIMYIESVR